jgi:DNA-binding transcriptional LysR family regulator
MGCSVCVVATPRALALREPIGRALGALRGALDDEGEFRPASIDRLFQIAALDALIVTIAPKLLARLTRDAPQARLAFRTLGREEALKAVREGRADLALGVFEAPGLGMTTFSLGKESFVVIARKGHALFRDGLSLEAWLATDHIVVSAAGDLHGAIDPILAARGLKRRTLAAVPQFLAAFATVAAGEATASVPASLARTFAERFGLAVYPPPTAIPPFELKILRARATAPDPALDWLTQTILELHEQEPALILAKPPTKTRRCSPP